MRVNALPLTPMRIQPFSDAAFGARVDDFDCADIDTGSAAEIRRALQQHQVLYFADQNHLGPRQEVAFCRAIDVGARDVWRDQKNNPWEVYKVEQGNQAGTYQLPEVPAVLVLGKGEIDHHGLRVTLGGDRSAYGDDQGSQVLGGGALQWHIDGPFYGFAPCHYTQMRCIEAPSGDGHWLDYGDGSGDRLWCEAGATAFASGRIACELLAPDDRRDCRRTRVHYASHPFRAHYALGNSDNGLRVIDEPAEADFVAGHDAPGGTVDDPAAQVYPLLWACPVTGQPALMPHPRCLHALEVDGDFLGVVESRHQVERWMRPAIAPALVYVHAWRPGDLVLWNNRSVWHSATGKLSRQDRRVMHLTAFNGDSPPLAG